MPRPIEVHAHDPLRYVGDMLGWLHQVGISVYWLGSIILSLVAEIYFNGTGKYLMFSI